MGFLDYLEDVESTEQPTKKVVEHREKQTPKQTVKKQKVLCLNVEVRTPKGARVVIEKLQDWIAKQEVSEGNNKPYRIPKKRVIKNSANPTPRKMDKMQETTSHAMNILDGLPDEPEQPMQTMMPTQPMVEESYTEVQAIGPDGPLFAPDGSPIMVPQMQQPQQMIPQNLNLNTVKGHASALL